MPSASETTPNLLFKKIIPYYLRSFHTNYIKVRNVDFFLKNQMKNYEEKYWIFKNIILLNEFFT